MSTGNKIRTWIIVITTILGFVIFWAYIVPVYQENADAIDAEIGEDLTGEAETVYESTQNSFGSLVSNCIVGVIVAMLIWGYLSMQRSERVEGYY